MHTNTTGGPTDRPVLHRRPEDAADQPTTEPSVVERTAEHLYETADAADKEHYRDTSHDLVAHSWCDLAPVWRRPWIEKAQALADAGLLAPAPQPAADKCDGSGRCTAHLHVHGCFADLDGHCDDPDDHPAADTETEVQWGVRYRGGHVVEVSSEQLAIGTVEGHRADGFPGLVVVKQHVTRTPWEEA